jgi:hypothetical protein
MSLYRRYPWIDYAILTYARTPDLITCYVVPPLLENYSSRNDDSLKSALEDILSCKNVTLLRFATCPLVWVDWI